MTTPMPVIVPESEQYAAGGQTVKRTELGTIQGRKYRIRQTSDTHRSQCTATADLWDGNRWQEVAKIEPYATTVPDSLVYDWNSRSVDNRSLVFGKDRKTLLAHLIFLVTP